MVSGGVGKVREFLVEYQKFLEGFGGPTMGAMNLKGPTWTEGGAAAHMGQPHLTPKAHAAKP